MSREDFDGMKQYFQEKRESRATVNIDQLKALNIPAKEQSKNVFRVDTKAGAVMYYPTSNTWQHRGKTLRGKVEDFRKWLKKNHFL